MSAKSYSSSLYNTKNKFARMLLGVTLTVTGLAIGVLLTTQQQFFGQEASVRLDYFGTPTSSCSAGRDCKDTRISGATACKAGGKTVYCCPQGQVVSRGKCVAGPAPKICAKGLHCSSTYVTGAGYCDARDIYLYCCPKGRVIRNGKCVIPFGNPIATPNRTPVPTP
jgi:hypothetical protein